MPIIFCNCLQRGWGVMLELGIKEIYKKLYWWISMWFFILSLLQHLTEHLLHANISTLCFLIMWLFRLPSKVISFPHVSHLCLIPLWTMSTCFFIWLLVGLETLQPSSGQSNLTPSCSLLTWALKPCLLFILTWQMLQMWSWSASRSFGLMSFIFWGESWTVSCLWLFSLFTSISELEVVTKVQTAQMNLVEQCAMSLCICIWP